MTSGSGRDQVVVGVDFGTLSGRAVVVRVADGAELGTRGPRVRARRDRGRAAGHRPAAAAGLGAAGARRTTSTCCADAVPEAVAASRRRRRRGRSASARTSPPAPCCRRSPTARRCASCRSARDRPHAYVKLWKHHAAQPQADRINALAARARRAVDRPLRRASSRRSGSSPRACSCWRRTRRSTRRTERWIEAADWIVWQLCGDVRPQRLHRRLQGGLPGRRATRPGTTSAALNPDFAGFVDDKLGAAARRARRARRRPDRARPPRWTGLPDGHRGRGRQRRRARHRAGRAGDRAGPDGRDHGHLDLPRDERRRAAPRCPACAASSTAASCRGLWGYEAGQSGVGDIFGWFVRTGVPAGVRGAAAAEGLDVHELPDRAGRRAAGRRARPGRAGLAQRQPLGAGRPRAVRPGRRPDAGHPAGGRLPRAARGDRVRHPDDHRGVRGERACRSREFVVAGGLVKNALPHADLRRRAPPAAVA